MLYISGGITLSLYTYPSSSLHVCGLIHPPKRCIENDSEMFRKSFFIYRYNFKAPNPFYFSLLVL